MIDLGIEGFCAWRWRLVQELPRARAGFSLGVFPLQHSGVQQGGVLGPTRERIGTLEWDPARGDRQRQSPREQR